jgi:hypothetical protein
VHLFEKGNDKEDHFNYLHIVEHDSASLENLFLGLEKLSLRRNKRYKADKRKGLKKEDPMSDSYFKYNVSVHMFDIEATLRQLLFVSSND